MSTTGGVTDAKARHEAFAVVVNNAGLLSWIAATASRELGLPKSNPALGKDLLRSALNSKSPDDCAQACGSVGTLPRSFTDEVFRKSQVQLKNVMTQLKDGTSV